MKTLTLLTLILAASVFLIAESAPQAQQAICSHYWSTDNPKLYWPLCDDWWTARPGYGDDD